MAVRARRPLRAILTYHSIDRSGSVISVAPDAFDAQIRWLSRSDFRVLPLTDLLALDPSDPADAVSLTFDDGFRNFTETEARLRDHGLPSTLFVVTGHVGGTNAWGRRAEPRIPTLPLLGWSELERLAGCGVTIGAHSRTHAPLTGLSPAGIQDELHGCREDLRARLGIEAGWFAYPYGAVNDEVAAATGRVFTGALTTRFATVAPSDQPMWLPRLDMYYFRNERTFDGWRGLSFTRKLKWIRALRRARRMLAAGW